MLNVAVPRHHRRAGPRSCCASSSCCPGRRRGCCSGPSFRMFGAPYTGYLVLVFLAGVLVLIGFDYPVGTFTVGSLVVIIPLLVLGWFVCRKGSPDRRGAGQPRRPPSGDAGGPLVAGQDLRGHCRSRYRPRRSQALSEIIGQSLSRPYRSARCSSSRVSPRRSSASWTRRDRGGSGAPRGEPRTEPAVGSARLTATLTATAPDRPMRGSLPRPFLLLSHFGSGRKTLRPSLGVKGSQVQILSSRRLAGRYPTHRGAALTCVYASC